MAPRTTLSAYQQAQRGPNQIGHSELEAAADSPPSNGLVAEHDPISGDLIQAQPTMFERLQILNVEARCTAEMNLHMVTERVRDVVPFMDDPKPTDAEIVAEAERIWSNFGDQRKGPREYTAGPDGLVRDWRRPDTTPDRGDVTTVHHIDAAEQIAQQASLFLVPSDSAFNGKLYRDAPELANIAERLIDRHGFLRELVNCNVRWYWKRKTGVSKGRVKIGFMKRASDLLGHFAGCDFIGWLSATTARDGKFSDTQVEAAVMHQLLHIGSDDSGNWIFAPHDFEGFAAEIRTFGVWTEGLKLARNAFSAGEQMGLFDTDDSEDDLADPDTEFDGD